MTRRQTRQIAIIGGGIAGASLAHALARRGATDAVVLEREAVAGFHSTLRSAATLLEIDPDPTLARLKLVSAPFLREPPPGFSERPIFEPTGVLALYRASEWPRMQAATPALRDGGANVTALGPDEVLERIPYLDPDEPRGGLWFGGSGRLDVEALLDAYLRYAKSEGAEIATGVSVRGIRANRARCLGLETTEGSIEVESVVNAAGAWAGEIAQLAGATPIEITPLRRSMVAFPAPRELERGDWPLVVDESLGLYFEPRGDEVLASPMDEDRALPTDARADTEAVDQVRKRLTRLAPRLVAGEIRRRWAGLRSFAADRLPVVGEDPRLNGFFWLAGQGGVGIATSPILSEVAADLLLEGRTDRFPAAPLAPDRFAPRS